MHARSADRATGAAGAPRETGRYAAALALVDAARARLDAAVLTGEPGRPALDGFCTDLAQLGAFPIIGILGRSEDGHAEEVAAGGSHAATFRAAFAEPGARIGTDSPAGHVIRTGLPFQAGA